MSEDGGHAREIAAFSALAEPNRLRIVELLVDGPLTVGQVAERLQLRQPQASKHLRVLLEAGLVDVQADANRRRYQLRLASFQSLDAWLESYRNVWNGRLDKLEHYIRSLQIAPNEQDQSQ